MVEKSHVMPTYNRSSLAFERGEGAWLFTESGDAYLDFASGIAVNALGHSHQGLIEALMDQANRLWHTSNLYTIPGQESLSARLCALTFADQVFFCNSGAEAMEGAIKTARKHFAARGEPDRYEILTFTGAFHGRTMTTLAAAGNRAYLDGFGPAPEGFTQLDGFDLDLVEQAIGPQTAAVLIEPVQGEGGIMPVPTEFMRGLRALCDAHDLLLIVDEVQCGVGRTGRLFAHEWAGISPDIMAVAKGIGGGFPLGAFLATERAASGMVPGTHGSTYGGNPLAVAVGAKVLEIVSEEGFLAEVERLGLLLKQKLAALKDRFPGVIAEIRGEGLMLGIKTVPLNSDMVSALREANLLTVGAGDNVVRLIPPLNLTDADIEAAMTALETACKALQADENTDSSQ
ncbi:MAG: aspartate aminotransferase family protein [Parvibaculales bacterium]